MTKTPYEKLLDEMKGFKSVLGTVAENMYKTAESQEKTLETMKLMVTGFKNLSEKFDKYIGAAQVERNPNEGIVLDEEECLGGMTHIIVGFRKSVSDVDIENMKKECVEKYGLDIAFVCKVNDKLVEVFMQESRVNE